MMLAVLIGVLSIFVGITTLFLPLFLTELSRSRDSFWGAMTIVLGLTVISMSHRFDGSPLLVLVLGAVIFTRLIIEISHHRWQLLTSEEKDSFKSFGRWDKGVRELFSTFVKLSSLLFELIQRFKFKAEPKSKGKKWIRSDFSEEKKSEKALESDLKSSNEIGTSSKSDQISLLSNKNMTSEDS